MYRVCIALVDTTRARLFTFERVTDGADTHEELVERTDFVNSHRRTRSSVAPSTAQPEARGTGNLTHVLDGHREHHISQIDDRFARMTMAGLRELIDEQPTQRVVISASPRMLGRLRAAAPGLLPGDIARDECPRDLMTLSRDDVQAELASRGLLRPASRDIH